MGQVGSLWDSRNRETGLKNAFYCSAEHCKRKTGFSCFFDWSSQLYVRSRFTVLTKVEKNWPTINNAFALKVKRKHVCLIKVLASKHFVALASGVWCYDSGWCRQCRGSSGSEKYRREGGSSKCCNGLKITAGSQQKYWTRGTGNSNSSHLEKHYRGLC